MDAGEGAIDVETFGSHENTNPQKINKKFTTTASILLMAALVIFPKETYAGSEDLQIRGIYRLTPSLYNIGNLFYSHRPVFNQDDTKIWIYESPAYTHPDYGKSGRGLCWGNLNDLKSWKNIAEYESSCKPFPSNSQISHPASLYWSILPGEKDIAYATFKDGWLKKIDTSAVSPSWSNVIYLVPDGASASQLYLRCLGWDKDKNLVCSLYDEDWEKRFGTNNIAGYLVNAVAPSKVPIYSWTSDPLAYFKTCPGKTYAEMLYNDFSLSNHGHGDSRPQEPHAGLNYGGHGWQEVGAWYMDTCEFVRDALYDDGSGIFISHIDWDNDDDWFIGDACGYPTGKTSPNLRNCCIQQRYYNLTIKSFGNKITLGNIANSTGTCRKTAAPWTYTSSRTCTTSADCWYAEYCSGGYCKKDISNYHTGYLPKMNNAGTAAVFTSTENGKYSYDDYQYAGVINWDMIGLWLVEFQSSATDTTPPAPPRGLKVE